MDQDERIAGNVFDPRATLKVKLDIQNVPTSWIDYNKDGDEIKDLPNTELLTATSNIFDPNKIL